MRRWFGLVGGLGLLSLGFLVVSQPVWAQFGDQAAVAAPVVGITASDSSLLIDPTNPRAGSLAKNYLDTVEAYRQAQKQFELARDQYYQLNTLTAQDEALRRAREMMVAQAQMTAAYFTYLQAIVERTNGINLTDKQPLIENLTAWQVALKDYQDEVPNQVSRVTVDQQIQKFNNWKSNLSKLGTQSITLIKIGEQQTALDTASLLAADMQTWINVENFTNVTKDKKQRGLDEVNNLLQQTRINLAQLRARYATITAGTSGYDDLQKDFDTSYVLLRQISAFLREVASL
jgi:hypothetical protein